jgi:D-serine deaminase-like pyridoxal phosphate-dependent protein
VAHIFAFPSLRSVFALSGRSSGNLDYNAGRMVDDLATPAILIDVETVQRNLERMASYARAHRLTLRPHTKTHKSTRLARWQIERGAGGLTVAKFGEARVMAEVSDDLLMAYPAVDHARCAGLAELARTRTVRVAVDSVDAADALSSAARSAGATLGLLVDLDVGYGRTGVQTPEEALALARHVDRSPGLRLDGLLFFPGHISGPADAQGPALRAVDEKLGAVLDLWRRSGLEASIVSGGSTPTAFESHRVTRMNEIRPGTYIFNDMNCVHGGSATLDDCAARIIATVVSTAVPGQVVIDAGSKTLTSDRCGPAPDSGFGYVVQYPRAKIVKLSEEHGQVDVTACDRVPEVGDRVTVIPNHICPCINLQDQVWWQHDGEPPSAVRVDARGKVQ